MSLAGALRPVAGDLARGDYTSEWEADALRARAYLRMGALDSAAAAGRRSVRTVERVRGNLASGVLKTAFTSARIQTYFDVVQNPIQPEEGRKLPEFGAGNDYYYLYGLERASLLGRIRFYGEYDWYEDGAELLMHDQHEDGHWPRSPPLVESCFAILFLKRATAGMANPVITPCSRNVPSPRFAK